MPRSFLVRSASSRRNWISTGLAEEIPPDETGLTPADYPGTSCVTFMDHSPLDFTIRGSKKEETDISRFAIAINGLYSEILKKILSLIII